MVDCACFNKYMNLKFKIYLWKNQSKEKFGTWTFFIAFLQEVDTIWNLGNEFHILQSTNSITKYIDLLSWFYFWVLHCVWKALGLKVRKKNLQKGKNKLLLGSNFGLLMLLLLPIHWPPAFGIFFDNLDNLSSTSPMLNLLTIRWIVTHSQVPGWTHLKVHLCRVTELGLGRALPTSSTIEG
jgi:hypothetical protein